MRCEFVGGPDESAVLTAASPSEQGAEVLHAPLESSSSSSQSSMPATLPLFVRGKVGLRVGWQQGQAAHGKVAEVRGTGLGALSTA